ncbi:YjgB family protein [Paenibacillus dendritiformis]|nr:YjgB family protein [Paenibacillus dendritiformis]NKI23665.1 YjgB family protein [Paenibacillus dendritiformis]NRF99409.1 YjgB family protein [Paenibacillus dendritiformis]
MMKLAAEGRVAHSGFAVEHGLMDDVEKEWGEPDKDEFAGQGMYATYEKRHIVFGYNKGMQIFDVRSDGPEVRKLTLEDVEKALGKAKDVRETGGDAIYVYEASADYELKFIVPKPTGKNPNPHVDHISVFYPQGSKNLMAG